MSFFIFFIGFLFALFVVWMFTLYNYKFVFRLLKVKRNFLVNAVNEASSILKRDKKDLKDFDSRLKSFRGD